MKNDILEEIDKLQQTINDIKPLSSHEANQLKEYFNIELTYTSNAIEGNSLTISETKIVIEDGITSSSKPLLHYLEAIGHSEAFDYMYSLSGDKHISQKNIQKLHYFFYHHINDQEAGIYRKEQNFISGTQYVPPKYSDVPKLMDEFESNIEKWKNNHHPVECAGLIHKALVDIHPFKYGNGQVARLLMNTYLIQHGYCIATISSLNKSEYINSLVEAQTGAKNIKPFMNFIQKSTLESQLNYLRLLHCNN